LNISKKDLKALTKIKSVESMMSRKNINYKELKNKIDNFLLDQQKKINDNISLIDHNGMAADLGRLDFSKKHSDLNYTGNFDIVKIFDIRKNENFGEINMFCEYPSPFTLKAKSRIVELFLLRKQEAIIISKNFPNIWRKIHSKSYHNYYSLKKLAIKILNRYYNTHFYNKNKKEKHFSFDSTIISVLDRPSFLKKLNNSERLNLIKQNKKRNTKNSIKKIKSTKIYNKTFLKFESNKDQDKRKSSVKTLNYSFAKDNNSLHNSNISSINFVFTW
jgi:hypothetical protein